MFFISCNTQLILYLYESKENNNLFFNYLNLSKMIRLQQSIISICPVLNLELYGTEKLKSELVFQFRSDQNVEPLYTMLRKYELNASIDIVEKWKFLFITF